MATCMERHRHQEWLKFLRLIDRQTAKEKQLHLIVDNYATHKHPHVLAWAARHPRFHFHFTPTSSSWLNMVERFFRDLTENQLRRGVFTSVEQLQASIFDYIQQHNSQPKPFIWTAKGCCGEGADPCGWARQGRRGEAGEVAGRGGCGGEGDSGDATGDAPDRAGRAERVAAPQLRGVGDLARALDLAR